MMKWIVAYISGIAMSVLSAVCIGFLFHGLNKEKAFVCLGIGLATAIFIVLKYKFSSGLKKEDFGFCSWAMIIFFIIFSLRAFLWILFRRGDGLFVLSPNNLGDISIHIAYIKYFANGVVFWPDNPIFSDTTIRYPIGIDLFNSLLVLIGVDLIRSLIWVAILSSIATVFALLVWGGGFTIAGFLFNGGLAGFAFFNSFILNDYQATVAWKNIFLSMFITQRGLLYSLPVGLLLLRSWREKLFNKEDIINTKNRLGLPLWVEIVLYSSMPLFHMHTFIFLSLLLGYWFCFYFNTKSIRDYFVYLIGISLIPMVFFVLLLTEFLKASSGIHFKLGWMQDSMNFFHFWILNFGILCPLIIYLCIEVLKKYKETNDSKAFIFPAIIFFVFFCFVMMSRWEWDNTKLMLWSYLILLPYLWKCLLQKWDRISRYLICFILFFSGFVSLIGGFPSLQGYEVFKFSEVSQIEQAIKSLPIENRFACFPTYNHPLMYCGRKVVMGYPGWLWSYGFDFANHEEKLKKLMRGENNWRELAKELGARYVFWGDREKREYSASLRPWEKTATKIASGTWGEIFDLGE